jgi:uncharacterized RDD family membrane protein YckC
MSDTDPAAEISPAKITDRFLAFFTDLALFMVGYYLALNLLINRLALFPNTALVWDRTLIVFVCLYTLYQSVGNALGATLGKRMFGIRVVGREGNGLGIRRSILRALCYFLSMPLMNLGFLWSLFQKDSRTWHDLIAGSYVIEPEGKTRVAALGSAALSFSLVLAIFTGGFILAIRAETSEDRQAIAKAREGLKVLSAIEASYHARYGHYTDSLQDLARESGDVKQFREAMENIFDTEGFFFQATDKKYILRARAKDRRKTVVTLQGP